MPSPDIAGLLRKRGLLTERDAAALIAGAPLSGSWWGHPKGKEIYAVLTALAEDPDVLLCKLIDGKQTFVHRALWPALGRVQRERALWPAASAEAKRLYTRVEKAGAAGLVATGKPRLELERALLVVGRSEHTPSGKHETVLVAFEEWLPADVARKAAKLALTTARADLAKAGFVLPSAP